MTKQEFTDRTLVDVSESEYEAIETVYMNSDLEKNDFCRLWCKMNASRVKAAKEAIKEQKRIAKLSMFEYVSEFVMNMANKASEENEGCQWIISDTTYDLEMVSDWSDWYNIEKIELYYLIRPTGASIGNKWYVKRHFEEFSSGKLYRLECSNILEKKEIKVELINEK